MRLTLAIAIATLCGCADNPVLDLGDGRHSVVDSSLRGTAHARAGALEAANAYCARRNQKAVAEQFGDDTVRSDLEATSSVIFRCR